MKKIDGLEETIIEIAFTGEDMFKSCCEDYLNYNKAIKNLDKNVLDLRKHTTTTGVDGVTTGIVCDVDFDKENNQIYLYLFVEGVFRWTVADEATRNSLIEAEQNLRKNTIGKQNALIFLNYVNLH